MGQGAGDEVVVFEEELAEFVEGLEGGAVFESAVLFDVGAFGVGFAFGDFFTLAEGAIPGAFAADRIKDFEGEAGGIDVIVAAGAGLLGAVFGELIADGDGATDVGFDSGDTGWRWRDGAGEDVVEDPDAAEDGGGVGAIGGDFEDAGVSKDAATDGVGRESDNARVFVARDAGDVVVEGEAFVEDGEVGVDEVGNGEVFFEEVGEEAFGFANHRFLEHGVEFGEELGGGGGEFDLTKSEPLAGEVFDEAFAFGRVEHALDLGVTDVWVGEFALGSEVEEFLVGHGGPKKVGELGGEGEIVGFFLAIEEKELGSAEDGGDAGADRLLEGAAFGETVEGEVDEGVGGFFGDGATEGARDEVTNDALGIGVGGGGGDVVGFDAFAVSHPDGGAGFESDGRGISKEGFLGNGGEGLVEGAVGFSPGDTDAGALFVFVAPGDVVGVDPGDDVEGFGFAEEGFELDDTGILRGAGDVKHAHEATFARAKEGAGVDGDGEGAVAGVVGPGSDAATVAAVFDGMGFVDTNGRPAGGEFDEGIVGADDAAFLFGEGIEVVLVVDDDGAAGLGGERRDAADGGLEGEVGRFEVAFHEDGGDAESVGNVIEALDLAVLGEEVGEGGVDSEEIADGEFVFDTIEAAEGDGGLDGIEEG